MLTVLDSEPVQQDLQKLTSLMAAASAPQQQALPELARKVAPKLIRRRYRKLRQRADALKPDLSMEAYHEIRGQVKMLRYTMEALPFVSGKPASEMLRALRRWQEMLGLQQDAATASRRLKAIARRPPKGITPETLFLMGRLAEHHFGAAMRARKLYAKRYRKVRERWKKLRSRFENPAANHAAANP
jgi:CHAD domain-containing protein